MKRLILVATLLATSNVAAAENAPLKQIRAIPLPGVSGRIDHMTVDRSNNRLFVCALGNNTVEVLDLHEGKRIRNITGLAEPQDVMFLSDTNRLLIANGGDGICRVFDGKTFEPVGKVDFQADADNLRCDPAAQRIYLGYGSGTIGIMDISFRRLGNIRLPGHPESFQLEKSTRRMFVNVPTARQIVVVDLEKQTITDTWKLHDAEGNFPMALDEKNQVLFVGCRRPARLLGLDTQSGRILHNLPIDADPDDICVDAERHRVYVSCGAGFLDVFAQTLSAGYRPIARIPTGAGARTSLFVPEMQQLFLAVPRRGQQEAEIRVYSLQPEDLTTGHQ